MGGLVLAAILLCWSPSASAGLSQEGIALTERLVVDAGGEYPRITSSGTVEAQTKSHVIPVRTLATLDANSREYESALEAGTLAHWLTTYFTVNPAEAWPPRPRPEVRGGRVSITTTTSDWVYGYESLRGIGDWGVRAAGNRIFLSITPGYPQEPLPSALTLRVLLELKDADLIAASTPPDTRVPGQPIEWEFRASLKSDGPALAKWRTIGGAALSQLHLSVAPRGHAGAFMNTNHGLWFTVIGPLLTVATWLVSFVLLAVVRRRWRRASGWGHLQRAEAVGIALGLVLLVAAVDSRLWNRIFAPTDVPSWLEWEGFVAFAVVLSALLVLLIRRRDAGRKTVLVALALGGAVLIGYLLQAPGHPPVTLPVWARAVLGTVTVIGLIAGTASLLVSLASSAFEARSPLGSRVATIFLAAILVAWWLWWSVNLLDATREVGDLGYQWAYKNPPSTLADALLTAALNYPGWLADVALAWLPLVALTAVASTLADDQDLGDEGVPPAFDVALLVVLFAAFVAGPWGRLFSLNLPLTAATAIAVLVPAAIAGYRRVSIAGLPSIDEEAVTEDPWLPARAAGDVAGTGATPRAVAPRSRGVSAQARKFLTALGSTLEQLATALGSTLERLLTALGSTLERLLTALRSTLGRLRTGPGTEPADLAPSDRGRPIDAKRDMLQAGPTAAWWTNGKLAVRIGLPVAIPFALHYLVLLYGSAGADLSPDWNPVGPLWALQWVTYEYAYWVVGALVLGALYRLLPGRTGVLKGAFLALIFTLAQGVEEAMPGSFDVMSWPAISAEAFIFFSIVGALIDAETLRRLGLPRNRLWHLYNMDRWATATGLVPVAGAILLLLLQQVISGEASNALSDVFQAVPSVNAGSR